MKLATNNSPGGCFAPLPQRYDRSSLEKPHPTYKTIQTTGMQAKRAILDHIGWIRWWFHGIAKALPSLDGKVFEEFKNFLTPFQCSRGVIFYLARDWQKINLPLLIQHRVPIFYNWMSEELIEPRFARLNPKLLATDEGVDGESVSLVDLDVNDEDLMRANQASSYYDEYLQTKDPAFKGGQLAFEMDSKFFIIDFEGWGRRALPDDFDPSRYIERYHFGVFPGKTVREPPNVIFWKWRKKMPMLTAIDDIFWNRRDDFDDESLIREFYRYEYSPPYPSFYDLETGEGKRLARPLNEHHKDFEDKGKKKDVSLIQRMEVDCESNSNSSSSGAFDPNRSSISRLPLLHCLSKFARTPPELLSNKGSWKKTTRERDYEREGSRAGSSSIR